MASLAKIILVGNLGRDAELKYTPSGAAVLEFSLAVNERSGDRNAGGQETTTWFRINVWGKQAETLKQYLVKGKQVYIDGRLRVREYTDRDGKNRTSLEVRADQIQLLGGRGEGADRGPGAPPPELQGQDPIQDDDIPF